jgi:hypothetical protein
MVAKIWLQPVSVEYNHGYNRAVELYSEADKRKSGPFAGELE